MCFLLLGIQCKFATGEVNLLASEVKAGQQDPEAKLAQTTTPPDLKRVRQAPVVPLSGDFDSEAELVAHPPQTAPPDLKRAPKARVVPPICDSDAQASDVKPDHQDPEGSMMMILHKLHLQNA